MTPIETEMLQSAWPIISSAIGSIAVWYLRTLTKALDKLSESISEIRENLSKVEKEIKTDLAEYKRTNQHRIDTLIGSSNSRIGKIEAVCEIQHGKNFCRRSTDNPNWAQTSDINGNSGN